MDIIDYEMKRYDSMKNDLETRKNPDAIKKDTSKSSDYLDTIMNEEKPKEVISLIINSTLLCKFIKLIYRWSHPDDVYLN